MQKIQKIRLFIENFYPPNNSRRNNSPSKLIPFRLFASAHKIIACRSFRFVSFRYGKYLLDFERKTNKMKLLLVFATIFFSFLANSDGRVLVPFRDFGFQAAPIQRFRTTRLLCPPLVCGMRRKKVQPYFMDYVLLS